MDIKHNYDMSIADSGMLELVLFRTTDMNNEFLTEPHAMKDLKHVIDVINIFD